MIKTEIVIIGAGISGNYLAYLLSQNQIPCIVIEKHNSFLDRPLQCAGIISQKIIDLVKFPSSIILNKVKKVKIEEPHGTSILMQGREQPLIIDRLQFDAYFGLEAQKLGTKYFFHEKYQTHWKSSHQTVIVQTNKQKIQCKIIIGADGPGSLVGKRFHQKIPCIPAAQVRIKYPYPLNQTTMIFNPKWRDLFGYIIPEGNNGISRIGLASKKYPGQKLQLLLSSIKASKDEIIERQGGLIPFGLPKRLVFDHTLLLGDAAGMVKATTGGGIIMSISAAKILGKALEKAFNTKTFTSAFFIKHYQKKFQRKLGLELKIHYLIRLFLLEMTPSEFKELFHLYNHTKVGKIIKNKADMDFPLKLLLNLLLNKYFISYSMKLVKNHPKNILYGVKALIFSKISFQK